MTDIVLPLPGYDITYPNNIVAEWYEEILKIDGLSSASLKQNVRKYSLSGSYRKVICHPKDFSWSSVQYNDPTVELVQSDLQRLKGESIPERVEDGPYKAVILDFCLPPSAYATMFLRDLLKCDTSTHHQMTLNNYFGGSVGAKREGDKTDDSEREAKVPRLQGEVKNNEETSQENETMDVENVVEETRHVKTSSEDLITDSGDANHKDEVVENISDESKDRLDDEVTVPEENGTGDKAEDLTIQKETQP
ncbi:hypothetical protein J437_LFUL006023 [Ladona fulva]|uniref:TRUD domain-containing protein n=1 Tax=Ladona fulva TaxID=123851 RepID=A0A8K0JZX1_LADFU|nr:hypothetical protein J437_LFUL006023 [Ladona fulva]